MDPKTSYLYNVSDRSKQHQTEDVDHVCLLPAHENIVVHYIYDGPFVSVRRMFRQMLTISESNPLCKIYLRSISAVRKEKTKQMHYHYYMIHPFSNFQRYWELFMLAILTLLFIVIPVDICFHSMHLMLFKLILDCCVIMGIVLTFWTGFLHSSTHKIVMNKKLIARRYIFGYFIVDCVTSSTIFLVVLQACVPKIMALHNVSYMKMLNYLKLIRFITWLHYWECFRQWRHLSIYKFKIIKLFLYYSFTIWWSACILYMLQLVGNYKSSFYTRQTYLSCEMLFNCVYHAVYMIFSFGSGEQPTNRMSVLIVQIITLIIGNFLYIYTIAQIMHIVQKCNSSKEKYLKMKKQLESFLRQKEIPEYTRRRVMMFFNFKYQSHFYIETDVLQTLNKTLRQEIFLHLHKDLILKSKMFKGIPPSLLERLVVSMKSRIYMCNDLIVQAGTNGSHMFFLYSGTVAVYTPSGREVCHLTEGTNFGEVSLIYEDIPRSATVIAIDTVEIATLNRQDFNKAIEPFPNVYENMRRITEDQIKHILLSDDDADSDHDDSTNDFNLDRKSASEKVINESNTSES